MSIDLANIGSLRDKVRFEASGEVTDAGGGRSDTWTPFLTEISARITPLIRGNEQTIAMGQQSVQTFEIWVRGSIATLAITTANRIVDERSGQTYKIVFISNPDERKRFLLINAQTGTAQ